MYLAVGVYMIWYFGFKQMFSRTGHVDIFLPRIAAVATAKALLWPYFIFLNDDHGRSATTPPAQTQDNLIVVLKALEISKNLLEEADQMVAVAGDLEKLSLREFRVYGAKIEVAASTLRNLDYAVIERIDGPLALHIKTYFLPGILRMQAGIQSGNIQEHTAGAKQVTQYFEWHNHNAQRLKSVFESIR